MTVLKQLIVQLITAEARWYLRRTHPKVIAVTGSVGKTSTKDAIAWVLKHVQDGRVRKSEKSFNSEIGVPLTVLGLPNAWKNPFRWILVLLRGALRVLTAHDAPRLLILEIGADHPGDVGRALRRTDGKRRIPLPCRLRRTGQHGEQREQRQRHGLVHEQRRALARFKSHRLRFWGLYAWRRFRITVFSAGDGT